MGGELQTIDNSLLKVLKERDKELNCLYEVEEILNNPRLSLPEIFQAIVETIPSGWQYPEICQAKIVYENKCYQPSTYRTPIFADRCKLKLDQKVMGEIEVSYIKEPPLSEEGYFLQKEQKLIRTIADRIGQTILYRQMQQVLRGWDSPEPGVPAAKRESREWEIIIELLEHNDKEMLLHICRKMVNYLLKSGRQEAAEILQVFSRAEQALAWDNANRPSLTAPLEKIDNISGKTFAIAAKYLSNKEITGQLKKWLQEEKANFLIKAIARTDASLREIIEAITRYKKVYENAAVFYSPTERWLKVELIRRFFSHKINYVNIARQYVDVSDFYEIANRIIYPQGSRGKLGGKSAGLFLAQQILNKEAENHPEIGVVKVPKSWYIASDAMAEFLNYNNLEELYEQKYKELSEVRIDYPHIIQLMKNAQFPSEIVKSLAMVLDDFGDKPLIVRSSSLLEDQAGYAFSGKHKSLFLANQGSKQKRLAALMDAIIEVYASSFSPDSIQYRAERGLLDIHEEMGILIQEVIGTKVGPYYFPLFAGVAFSNNEFRWSPRIRREDGLLRLVPGLGTRAVDRLSDDFPVLISPGQPGLRVNSAPEENRRYSPRKIDVINLEKDTFQTIELTPLLKEYGEQIPNLHQLVSVYADEHIKEPLAFEIDVAKDELVVTFTNLINQTKIIQQLDAILKLLKQKMNTPVDLEFAWDGQDLYLLQCRPQSYSSTNTPAPIPKDLRPKDIIFSANRYIANGNIQNISHVVYVDPAEYAQLDDLDALIKVGKAVGFLNSVLPKRQFILMGPGRWGSRGDVKLGVQVSYADLNNTAALIEIARKQSNYIPELSFGTHFFQDLVEADIRYLPLYPDDKDVHFNEGFFKSAENVFAKLLPQYADLAHVIRVIDLPQNYNGRVLAISMNADLEEAVGYLTDPTQEVPAQEKPKLYPPTREDDWCWRWRYHMATCIAAQLDLNQFGVRGIYLFGSTNNGTAGHGSDIDLLIHFQGTDKQRQELLQWLRGWSLCLDEINYLNTGYKANGLLDVHLVTDADIAQKTAFAMKINAVTDPAHPLKVADGT